jgi:hypothetical protein
VLQPLEKVRAIYGAYDTMVDYLFRHPFNFYLLSRSVPSKKIKQKKKSPFFRIRKLLVMTEMEASLLPLTDYTLSQKQEKQIQQTEQKNVRSPLFRFAFGKWPLFWPDSHSKTCFYSTQVILFKITFTYMRPTSHFLQLIPHSGMFNSLNHKIVPNT